MQSSQSGILTRIRLVERAFALRKGPMNYRCLLSVSGLSLSSFLFCVASDAAEQTFDGYLMDRKCSASVLGDPHPEDFIKHHTKDCCLMANCKKRGYAIYVKARWLVLDRHGNKLAIKLLEKSARRSGFYVRACGSVEGDRLTVKTIEEIEEPATEDGVETR